MGEIFRENKQDICDKLLETLKSTRALNDLVGLKYDGESEVVEAVFEKGYTCTINVAMDSGIAMIRDILRALN